MIAFHYPPVMGSSGIQRTLKFSTYLPEHNWTPIVLTPHHRAYERTSQGQVSEVAGNVIVKQSFALDTARHLSLFGYYPRLLALPDRWVSWWLGGVITGLSLIRKHKPDAIWSTYPIATAHLIGLTLNKLTGVPWIADFRDSMTEENYPRVKSVWKSYRWIERKAMSRCARAVFTTPGAKEMYAKRYPGIPLDKLEVIENGYDEGNFAQAEVIPKTTKKLILVHSGLLYPYERNPYPFFDALAQLNEGQGLSGKLEVILRGSGYDQQYQQYINDKHLGDVVKIQGPVSYKQALSEMVSADGLLLFQGSSCNHQIPAKVYEYARAGKPIFALTDESGNTADLLRNLGINSLVDMEDSAKIANALEKFISAIGTGDADVAKGEMVEKLSRRYRTFELAEILNQLSG